MLETGAKITKRQRRVASRETLHSQSGFTLIEVLVVLMIIGMIMSLAGPRVLGYFSDSKLKSAKIQTEALSSSLELFYLDNGRYPSDSEGLKALVVKPSGLSNWNGPYVKSGSLPQDPWGNPYKYTSVDRGRSYQVSFVGPEGREPGDSRKSVAAPR